MSDMSEIPADAQELLDEIRERRGPTLHRHARFRAYDARPREQWEADHEAILGYLRSFLADTPTDPSA